MDQTEPRTPSSIVGEILHLTLGSRAGHRILDLANSLETAARAETLAEAADIASAEGMRLELEIGLEQARGARSAAARIRRAGRHNDDQRPATEPADKIDQLRTDNAELRKILADHVTAAIALGTKASAWAAGTSLAELLEIHGIDLSAEYAAQSRDDTAPAAPGFDSAEFHCYRCGAVVKATSTDPEAFGRLAAEHRAVCPQTRTATAQGA